MNPEAQVAAVLTSGMCKGWGGAAYPNPPTSP
jgi:ABC-type uncharacterized transport system permease subunit